MAKVVYSMNVSLAGYVEDPNGSFEFSAPDEDVHQEANEQTRSTSSGSRHACRGGRRQARSSPAKRNCVCG